MVFYRILLAAACACGLIATAYSVEPDWNPVATALKAGDPQAALEATDSLLTSHGEAYEVHRVRGICLLELGRENEAAKAFRKALALEPDSPAAHFYLAKALAYQGFLVEALDHLERVRELAPSSTYARQASTILPELENLAATALARKPGRRWDLYLRAAAEFDDNVPARAENRSQENTDAARLALMAYAELRLLDQDLQPSWPTLAAGYTYYATFHEPDMLRDYDVTSHNVTLSLARELAVARLPVELSVEGGYSETDLGDDPYSENSHVEGKLQVQPLRNVIASFAYLAAWKEFEDDTEFPTFFSRDGTEQEWVGELYTYFLENRVIAGLEYGFMENDVDGSQFEMERNRVEGSLTVSLPWQLRWMGSVEYADEDYEDFTPDPRRLDDVYTFYTSLSRTIFRESLRAELSFTHTEADSNRDFAEYERSVSGFAISYSP